MNRRELLSSITSLFGVSKLSALAPNERRVYRYPALPIVDAEHPTEPVLIPGRTGYLRKRRVIPFLRFPSQVEFDELDVKFKGFSGPIGSGKSKALVMEAIKLSYLNPGVPGLIGAPTYKLLTDSTTVELLATLDEQEIPHRWMPSSHRIHIQEPNSTILLRTLDEPERLRAMNLGWFGVDELSYCKEAAWTRLEGRLRHPDAKVKRGFAVWTPKGKDWVYRQWISSRKVPHYHCVKARPFENRAILDSTPDFYSNLKLSYDEKFYKQEVLGEYVDMFAGAVYHAFAEENVRPNSFNPSLPLIVALDFNIDPMCGVLLQCDESPHFRTVNVLKEIVLPGSHTAAWIEQFVRATTDWQQATMRSHGPLKVNFYGDPAGRAKKSSSGGKTDWSIIEEFMYAQRQYEPRFLYGKSAPAVSDRVNAVNGMLCSFGDGFRDAGQRRLFIDPSCRELLLDFEDVKWKVDAAGNSYPELDKSDKKRSHTSDALGYYIESEHGLDGSNKVRFSKSSW